MTWTAYVDESEPSDGGTYLLSCALVAQEEADSVRAALSQAKPPAAKKLHWHRTRPADRPDLARTVAGLPALHVVVVRQDCHDEPSERRRRKCLECLLVVLDRQYDVTEMVIEARQGRQNARDLTIVNLLRATGVVRSAVRVRHVPGPQEALLWVPDVVAGAFGAREPDVWSPLSGLVDVVRC